MQKPPPTMRVVSIVEFLTVRERPQSAAVIADGLDLSRSTVGAILAALDEQGWVTRLPDLSYQLGPALIAISDRGQAGAADIEEVDVIADVVSFLSDNPASADLRDRVVALLSGLNGAPCEPAQLAVDTELPVSVLTAPVFDGDGAARWELQIGPFEPAVARDARRRYVDELTSTAATLSES